MTSYALPPHTSFTTAPYSLYRKGAKGSSQRPPVRYTYAATSQSSSGDKAQILCFIEQTQRDGNTETVKSTYTVPRADDDVIAIESTPEFGDKDKANPHHVVVVFASGHISCLSPDLQMVKWEADLEQLSRGRHPKGDGELQTLHVTATTAKAAMGGLLRHRQDIVAILDPSLNGTSDALGGTTVLCVMFRLSDGRSVLSLFYIQPRTPDLVSTRGLPVKHLLTWDLPQPSSAVSPLAVYHLHASSGMMHQLVDGRLISYDFSGTIPKVYSNFHFPASGITSFLRISPDLMLTTTEQSLGMVDVKYESMQSLLPLGRNTAQAIESKKRKLEDRDLPDHSDVVPTLVAYFAESGLAVGVSGQELVAIQISESISRKRPRTNDALLINAIGKGISHRARGKSNNSTLPEWEKRVHKLEKYASKGKVAEFEEHFAACVGVELKAARGGRENGTKSSEPEDKEAVAAPPVNGVDDAPAESELRRWKLPRSLPESQRSHFRPCAMFALNKIFEYATPETTARAESRRPSLTIKFFPPNVFEWLLLSGYVTKESIGRAFKDEAANEITMAATIADGDIIKALVNFDPELHILSAILNHRHYLPVGEVVQAIRVLVQSLDDQTGNLKVAGLLTEGKPPTQDETDVDFTSELDAANHDLEHALSVLDNGLLIRSHSLRPALIRLHTFSSAVIASTLRSMLPRRELESFIRLLHTELRNGGWTSPYDFLEPDMPSPEDPDDHAVAIIASLLSSALDAIGAGAWLASIGDSAADETSEDIIHDLLHDTSEALNGFWEARFMRGLLSEFLRYASNLPKSQKPSNKGQNKPIAVDLAPEDALPMLPLGGKVDLGVERTKPGKGGKREDRSAREIGMLTSKRVPKYSVDKIVI